MIIGNQYTHVHLELASQKWLPGADSVQDYSLKPQRLAACA
jgi:hypothetical protein